MATILCAMPEATYRRMMTPELEKELHALGDILDGSDVREMSDAEYGALWEQADAALTGWGVRSPTPAILQRASKLKVISHTAGSVRMLPREAIEMGITITTARSAMARTVAEFCLLNALFLLRRYHYFTDSAPDRQAFYSPDGNQPRSETLFGKTVGLVGFGCIAQCFRELLRPFGCRVLAFDPYFGTEALARHDVEAVDLPAVMMQSKIVSLHVPDIPATHDMIGSRELSMLQDGAILLNSARGRVIRTESLTAALETGRFFAAIDVTYPEPLPLGHALRSLPNVLFTPHIAGPTDDEMPGMTRLAISDMARCLRGEPPLYPMTLASYDLMSF